MDGCTWMDGWKEKNMGKKDEDGINPIHFGFITGL